MVFTLAVDPASGPPSTNFLFTVSINEPAAANSTVTLTIQGRVQGAVEWTNGESKDVTIDPDGIAETTFQTYLPNEGTYESRVMGVLGTQTAYTNIVSFEVTVVPPPPPPERDWKKALIAVGGVALAVVIAKI